MKTLQDKVAVITGGSRGLGLAAAQAYAREGAKIIIGSRSVQAVEQAVSVLRGSGAQVAGQACDVSEQAQVEALAQFALRTFGCFDVWVNNAGFSAPYGPTVHVPPDKFLQSIQTNIFGTYYGSIAAMRYFLPRRVGKLINIMGRGDRSPAPLQNAYAATKAWVRSFTLALAQEYKKSGVGVYAFNPGMMTTDLVTRLEAVQGYEERLTIMPTLLRVLAQPPQAPAHKLVWLASSATDGRTGLEVREMNFAKVLWGAWKETWRRLALQKAPELDMTIVSVPPAIDVPIEK